MTAEQDEDPVAALQQQTGLLLTEEEIAALRSGYAHLQQLRAALHRTRDPYADLAPVFVPEFDR